MLLMNRTLFSRQSWMGLILGCLSVPAHGAVGLEAPPPSSVSALALSDAFAAVVDQTKGSIVSVLSEKVLKPKRGEFSLPFNDPFFRHFFGNAPESPMIPKGPVAGL